MDSCFRSVQNIALLSMLSNVLDQQETSEPEELPHLRLNIQTSLPQPRQLLLPLVQVLAYLATVDIDKNHITAVGVELLDSGPDSPDNSSSRLRIHVAINKSQPSISETILDRIVASFQKLFSLCASPSSSDRQRRNRLLAEIVDLCHSRISDRLGLTSKRTFIGALLQRAIEAFEGCTSKQKKTAALRAVLSSVPATIARLRSDLLHPDGTLNPDYPPDSLTRAVYAIYRLEKNAGPHLESAVSRFLTNFNMGPTERESLVNRLREIARYVRCANFLCRLASDARFEPLLNQQKVQVLAVQPPAADFTCVPDATTTADAGSDAGSTPLLNTFQRCSAFLTNASNIEKKYIRSGTLHSGTFANACTHLRGALHSNQPKIHAEVQIAVALEREHSTAGPKTTHSSLVAIRSNKKACFLCHAFMQASAQRAASDRRFLLLDIPPTHGRLYDGWRVPYDAGGGDGADASDRLEEGYAGTISRLNGILERYIASALERLQKGGPRLLSYGRAGKLTPHESPLFDMAPSSNSLALTAASVVEEEGGEEEEEEEEEGEVEVEEPVVAAGEENGSTSGSDTETDTPPSSPQSEADPEEGREKREADQDSDVESTHSSGSGRTIRGHSEAGNRKGKRKEPEPEPEEQEQEQEQDPGKRHVRFSSPTSLSSLSSLPSLPSSIPSFHNPASSPPPSRRRRYAANELELFIDYDSWSPASSNSRVVLRRLSSGNDNSRSLTLQPSIDLTALPVGVDMSVSAGPDGLLYLRSGSSVYEMAFS